jgi:hypothetical protein
MENGTGTAKMSLAIQKLSHLIKKYGASKIDCQVQALEGSTQGNISRTEKTPRSGG